MEIKALRKNFIVVGENIHATRVLLRGGQSVTTTEGGQEAVRFQGVDGETRYLPIPEEYKNTQEYRDGRVKHIKIAIQAAMSGRESEAQPGLEYLQQKVRQQLDAGADFIDLNVDEVSLRPEDQKAAMSWLVQTVRPICSVPLSIDSSNTETIRAGLEAGKGHNGRPLLNSASLERKSALELVVEYRAQVVVTAAGESGMPEDDVERVANASRIVELALEKGIPLHDLYIDALVFPISVDSDYGNHYFEAVRKLREKFGPEIHITGGLSNVSFGLPMRRLVNNVFLILATEAGADSGIIDPAAGRVDQVLAMDRQSRSYQVAADLLLGRDIGCRDFLRAFRSKELQTGVGAS
ncbi:MAG: dihydropteroate synthase [Pseudomonadota bacterium]